ncbi:MAG: hypothetical protein ACR2PL_16750 [Dehalococcoidia bacterium]
MAEPSHPIGIDTLPQLARLADEVPASRTAVHLQRDSRDVAILVPADPSRQPWKRHPTSEDDPIWNIVGIAASDGPGK